MASEERLSRNDSLGTFRRDSQRAEWGHKAINLPNEQGDQTLRSSGQGFNGQNLGEEFENNRSTRTEKQGETVNGDRNRSDVRKYLENLARTARERTQGFIERIRELASRKRLDTATIQRSKGMSL
ncbi:TPA: hypothetical protein ACY37W_002182 [Pasteurella multocida]